MEFRCAHASAPDWRDAVRDCLAQLGRSGGTLGFIYASDLVGDRLGDIVEWFRDRTGVPHWVGTVGIGVCATGQEYLDEPALSVLVGDFEPESFRVFQPVAKRAELDRLDLRCGGATPGFAIVHADPLAPDLAELVSGLAGRVESGFLVGGLASSRGRNVQIADGPAEGGVSGVAFADSVAIATRLTQGCSPIGPKHVVTAAQQNVIVTLDERPALDVLREDIGEALARDLNRVGGQIFAGLPIAGSDTGDYLVRNLVGIDPSNKLIAIGDLVQQGAPLVFCRRDSRTAQEDMKRMLDSIRSGLFSRPSGALYYSCLGRGAPLFGPDSGELKMIRDALGDVPLAGFFCNGEISHNRLYGYTGVLTLFV